MPAFLSRPDIGGLNVTIPYKRAVMPYCDVIDEAALAIGSEGRGLSGQMLKLCDKTIRIPMAERCESLNAAIAAAVLLWEAYR